MATLTRRPLPRSRLSRSALFVFGATAALSGLSASGCAEEDRDAAEMPRDASTTPGQTRDASDDGRATSGLDGALGAPFDASPTQDARTSRRVDASFATPRTPNTDAGASEEEDDDFGIPIYALVAPPLRPSEHHQELPKFAHPARESGRQISDHAELDEQLSPSAKNALRATS